MDLENLKDHIKNVELDFDQNEVWSNIQREQKKGKKKFFFWWSSLLMGILIVVALFYILDSTSQKDIEVKQNTESIQDQNQENFILNESLPNEKIIEEKIVENYESRIHDHNKSTVSASEVLIESNSNTTSRPIESTEVNRIAQYENNNSIITTPNHIDKSLNKSAADHVENKNSLSSDHNNLLSNYTRVDAQNNSSNGTLSKLLSIDNVPGIDISKLDFTSRMIPTLDQENNDWLITDEVEYHVRKKFEVCALAQYGLLQRSLKSNNRELYSTVQREESEEVLDHSILGMQVNIPITNRYFMTTGLELNRLSTKLEFSDASVRPLTLDDLPNGVQNVSGFVVMNSNNKYYNHVDLVNVPLLFGARWNQTKWTESFSIGTTINLYSSSRQLMLDEWNLLVDNSEQVKSKFNNSYLLSASLAYKLWSKFEWSMQASFRYTPNIMDNQSRYSQSYRSYLLGTGIAYKF